MGGDLILYIVVGTALAFDFTNGFHDTANAVATAIGDARDAAEGGRRPGRRPELRRRVHLAEGRGDDRHGHRRRRTSSRPTVDLRRTDRRDHLEPHHLVVRPAVELLARADRRARSAPTLAAAGTGAVQVQGVVDKVLVPGIVAPILAFVVAGASILIAYLVAGRQRPAAVARGFRLGQLVTSSLFALAHGTNDAQKTMGVITLALIAHGNLPVELVRRPDLGDRELRDRDRARHLLGRLAHHQHDGHAHHQDGPGAGLLGAERQRGRPVQRHGARLPALDDARRLRRDHGRRAPPSASRRSAGGWRATSRSPGR